MATQTRAHAFAHQLRLTMVDRGLSVRALGRAIDPVEPERGRRKVQRSLSGMHMPNPSTRRDYAVALDEPTLAEDEADEESDQRMRAARLLFGDLFDRAVEAGVMARLAQTEGAQA